MSNSTPPRTARINRQLDGGLAVVLALAALLLISVFWAVGLRSDRDDAKARIADLQGQIQQLRVQANATAYQLNPTVDAPEAANGTAFFSLAGNSVISVSNLDPAPEGRSYQVWYYPTAEAEPLPGATFAVDDNGSGFMLIPADVGVFTGITITLEPEAGTAAPTGPVILSGTTGGARG